MTPTKRLAIIRQATANIATLQAAVAVLQDHQKQHADSEIQRVTEQITTICGREIEHQMARILIQTRWLAPSPTQQTAN
jgi:pyruvate/2-oxoglutarate/acetoin dehydrogenase E1 component